MYKMDFSICDIYWFMVSFFFFFFLNQNHEGEVAEKIRLLYTQFWIHISNSEVASISNMDIVWMEIPQ